MATRGLASVVTMTVFYWISDLIVALWVGGLLTVGHLFALPLELLPGDAGPQAAVLAAETAIGMIDKLRPLFVAAAIILIASVVLSVILERQARHSVGWWVMWVVRSAVSVGMVAVGFYSLGEIAAGVAQVEQDIASVRSPTASFPGTDTTAVRQGLAPSSSLPGSRTFGEGTTETVFAGLRALHGTYKKWMWIEFVLGAFILLAGAIKEAAWRHSWVTEREIGRRVREVKESAEERASEDSSQPGDDHTQEARR